MSAVHPSVDETLVHTLIMAASPKHELARASDCPFCTDSCMWPHLRRQHLAALQDDRKLHNTLVPLALYQRHLSHHMEQLALFAVPSVASDIHDNDADNESQGIEEQNNDVGISVSSESSSSRDDMLEVQTAENEMRAKSSDPSAHTYPEPEEATEVISSHDSNQPEGSGDQASEERSDEMHINDTVHSEASASKKQHWTIRQPLPCAPCRKRKTEVRIKCVDPIAAW